jgi:hypothetical protein
MALVSTTLGGSFGKNLYTLSKHIFVLDIHQFDAYILTVIL